MRCTPARLLWWEGPDFLEFLVLWLVRAVSMHLIFQKKKSQCILMQTPLVKSMPQRHHHKELYFPMQSVLLWIIWPTYFSHIHSWFAWRLGVLVSLHISSINILPHQQNTINMRLRLHGRVLVGTVLNIYSRGRGPLTNPQHAVL